ncbi:MAG: argininosuccinate lyase [Nitriliruptorales bacterium]|nr:argininosuccinate lyase [Nitriliruptorales bacterium]
MTDHEGRLWGGRFAEAPDAAAWSLGRSVHFDVRLWPYDVAGSRAHADELRRLKLVTAADHAAITSALEAIQVEFGSGTFTFRDSDEDLHGAIERRMVELAGEAGGRLRAGRSRNDQIASDLRLYLRDAIDATAPAVRELQHALADRAEETLEWPVPGYTHLQRAQPVTLGHHLLAHAWALERDHGRLLDARGRLDVSTLGAGALAGVTLGIDPAAYASSLGMSGVARNSMDAVADRDFAVEFLAAAALLGVHMSRLGEEIVLWSSTEFGWVRVGDAFSTGSSIMPQKRNPDVAELVRGKTGRLIGALVSLLVTLKGLPLTYNRDLQEDKEPVFDAADTLLLTLPAMAGTVRSLVFDRERLAETAGGEFALATDAAEELVRRGVPFREAHERVGRLVAACESQGIDIADMDATALRQALPALGDAGPELLTLQSALSRRDATFGTAPDQVRAQLAELRGRLDG